MGPAPANIETARQGVVEHTLLHRLARGSGRGRNAIEEFAAKRAVAAFDMGALEGGAAEPQQDDSRALHHLVS